MPPSGLAALLKSPTARPLYRASTALGCHSSDCQAPTAASAFSFLPAGGCCRLRAARHDCLVGACWLRPPLPCPPPDPPPPCPHSWAVVGMPPLVGVFYLGGQCPFTQRLQLPPLHCLAPRTIWPYYQVASAAAPRAHTAPPGHGGKHHTPRTRLTTVPRYPAAFHTITRALTDCGRHRTLLQILLACFFFAWHGAPASSAYTLTLFVPPHLNMHAPACAVGEMGLVWPGHLSNGRRSSTTFPPRAPRAPPPFSRPSGRRIPLTLRLTRMRTGAIWPSFLWQTTRRGQATGPPTPRLPSVSPRPQVFSFRLPLPYLPFYKPSVL